MNKHAQLISRIPRLRILSLIVVTLTFAWLMLPTGQEDRVQAQTTPGITSPRTGEVVSGAVPVIGTADTGDFQRYELYYKPAFADDSAYLYLDDGPEPIFDDQLAIWDTSDLTPGEYTLRLRVVKEDGNYAEYFAENIMVNPDVTPTPRPQTGFRPAPTALPNVTRITSSAASRTITMVGFGRAAAPADRVTVGLFLRPNVGPDQTASFRLLSEPDLQTVNSFLISNGVVAEEIRTYNFSRTPAGNAVQEIRFTYRQPGNLAPLLANLIAQIESNPALRLHDVGVRYGLANCADLEAEAMRTALADAQAQADRMAGLLNVRLTALLAINENVSIPPLVGGCAELEHGMLQPLYAETANIVSVAVNLAATYTVEPLTGVAPTPTFTPEPLLTPTPLPNLVLPTDTPTPTPTLTVSTFTHIVQPGETIQSIATRYNVTVEAILAVNPSLTFESVQNLQPNQALAIPYANP